MRCCSCCINRTFMELKFSPAVESLFLKEAYQSYLYGIEIAARAGGGRLGLVSIVPLWN